MLLSIEMRAISDDIVITIVIVDSQIAYGSIIRQDNIIVVIAIASSTTICMILVIDFIRIIGLISAHGLTMYDLIQTVRL